MTYSGLLVATDKLQPHLGGAVQVGDPFTYCPSVWDYVLDRFGISSVMDLGSGSGVAALHFFKRNLPVLAVEGLDSSVLASVYPSVKHDLTVSPVITKVDLVHCQEVVEHIEEKYLDNLLTSLCSGKIILMTHGLPGQQGYHHVNLQSPDYWIEHLKRWGCLFLEEDTKRIRELAKKDRAPYMANTGLVFANQNRS